jgi:hypothetical protein
MIDRLDAAARERGERMRQKVAAILDAAEWEWAEDAAEKRERLRDSMNDSQAMSGPDKKNDPVDRMHREAFETERTDEPQITLALTYEDGQTLWEMLAPYADGDVGDEESQRVGFIVCRQINPPRFTR